MTEENRAERPQITITAGAWIGLVTITFTIVLSLFGAAGWIISRMDTAIARLDVRIDRLDTRIDRLDGRLDTLAEEVAMMRGQLEVLTRTRSSDPTEAEPGTTTGQ